MALTSLLREVVFLPHLAQNSESLFCTKLYFQYSSRKITT